MENITIKQIIEFITILLAIGGFIATVIKLYKSLISDKIIRLESDISILKKEISTQKTDIEESKTERQVLLKGLLACLKGLHNDLNCNGPVTQGIADIEDYLMNKSHK